MPLTQSWTISSPGEASAGPPFCHCFSIILSALPYIYIAAACKYVLNRGVQRDFGNLPARLMHHLLHMQSANSCKSANRCYTPVSSGQKRGCC